MDETDKIIAAYSHPVRRARLGDELWAKIRKNIVERAHAEGKDLPDYFEEEELMDLDRANLQNAEEEAKHEAYQ